MGDPRSLPPTVTALAAVRALAAARAQTLLDLADELMAASSDERIRAVADAMRTHAADELAAAEDFLRGPGGVTA